METTITSCNTSNTLTAVNTAANENENFKSSKQVKISYGYRVKPADLQTSTLSWVFEQISSDAWKDAIEAVRKEKDKDKRKAIKTQTLSYFNIGLFRENYRNNENLISTEFMLFDFDHLTKDVKEGIDYLRNNPQVYAAFISPSGDGVKVIFRLKAPIKDKAYFSNLYKHYAKQFGADLGEKEDKTSDVSRPCFFSYDPDIYINEYAEPLELLSEFEVPKKAAEKRKNSKNYNAEKANNTNTEKRDEMLEAIKGGIKEGGRNTALVELAGLIIKKGFDNEFVMSLAKLWNASNNPPLPEEEVETTVNYVYATYNKNRSSLPMQLREEGSQYIKVQKGPGTPISSFVIVPKELLVLKDSDCLTVNVMTSGGQHYEDIMLENTDWHSKSRFLKAIGHQDCTFYGSDTDLQVLCSYVNSQIKLRKTGTKVIGLHDDTWVIKNCNITKHGMMNELTIVPFEKGTDAFYHKIEYKNLTKEEYSNLIHGLYGCITRINEPEVILPWIGWLFACPMKPKIMETTGGFPLMFAHGFSGGGKTSTANEFSRLMGYIDPKPESCTSKSFPMLKLLSANNAVPVVLDEFKPGDMKQEDKDNLIRFMRKAYSGETESKGRPDQTVENYVISAPMTVMGEWDISEVAIRERVIVSSFSDVIKKNPEMKASFKILKGLPLEGFMPEYVSFCLGQDIAEILRCSQEKVEKSLSDINVSPRILNNLAVMVTGLTLFEEFGKLYGVKAEAFDLEKLLKFQLSEITGNKSGMVKNTVDYLIEELSVMALNEKITERNEDFNYKYLDTESGDKKRTLVIQFNKVFPIFKEFTNRTDYEHEKLDKKSYLNMMDSVPYVIDKNRTVRFPSGAKRCLCIDLCMALEAGLTLDGFKTEDCEAEKLTIKPEEMFNNPVTSCYTPVTS